MRKKIIVTITLIFIMCTHLLLAEDEKGFAEEQLYKNGLHALKQKDYVSGLKYLYAFRVINKAALEDHKDLAAKIDQNISFCEDILNRLSNLYTSGSLVGAASINAQGYERPDVEFKSVGKIVLDNKDVGYIIVGPKTIDNKETFTVDGSKIEGLRGKVDNKYDLKSIIELEKLEREKSILDKKIELEKLKTEKGGRSINVNK